MELDRAARPLLPGLYLKDWTFGSLRSWEGNGPYSPPPSKHQQTMEQDSTLWGIGHQSGLRALPRRSEPGLPWWDPEPNTEEGLPPQSRAHSCSFSIHPGIRQGPAPRWEACLQPASPQCNADNVYIPKTVATCSSKTQRQRSYQPGWLRDCLHYSPHNSGQTARKTPVTWEQDTNVNTTLCLGTGRIISKWILKVPVPRSVSMMWTLGLVLVPCRDLKPQSNGQISSQHHL